MADSYKLMNLLSHLFLSQFFRTTLLAGVLFTFAAFTAQNLVAQETSPAKYKKCTADSKCAKKGKCTKGTDGKKCEKCAKKSECADKKKCAAKAECTKCEKCARCSKGEKYEKCAKKSECADKKKCAAKAECTKYTDDKRGEKCAKKGKYAKCSEGKKCEKRAKKAEAKETVSLTGEIIEINADRGALLVKHEAIEGFMPAMTMEFRTDPSTLKTLEAGQKITAQLKGDWLSDISVQ